MSPERAKKFCNLKLQKQPMTSPRSSDVIAAKFILILKNRSASG